MAAGRPTWQGHLRLSLVTCPVALYTATDASSDVHFNMLHKKTHNRIRMIPTDPDLGPIERADIVKGYEVSKGEYVVVTQDEIDSVRLESTRTIDIERFVSADEIDRLYWDNPYFLVPDGKLAAEAYGVIREAMSKAGQVALGRVVMHQRERLLAIEPRDNGMVAWSLRNHDEVRAVADYFDDIPDKKPDAAMIQIAQKIIEQKEGPFDPEQFNDRYEDALRALIKDKQKGKGRKVVVEEPEDTNVVDLMEALRSSLGKAPAKAKPAAKKAPAARKKAS
ncbi:Ku protein [Caulobacter sp.]|uniref:non-homologous end joining protein Ku n=1 Tax=Caulobacter sp. TaxID=78 RepID=UPI001B28DEFC|nr:Ku protein [Caulobacter sp.]MBO9544441.1 Ku protein [Caulobacter sp.]